MTPAFHSSTLDVIEFGVGLNQNKIRRFALVPVDSGVQTALLEMVHATREALSVAGKPVNYQPSEKYAGREHLHLALGHELASRIRELHEANNLAVDAAALSNPSSVFCYFARLTNRKGHRLTAIRRATTFKGILKSRLIQLATDALKLVRTPVFKLDQDFDFLVDHSGIHILRHAGFEFIGDLESAILGAVSKNIRAIEADLPFVDFSAIESYAARHPRAARYIASIRAQQETKNVDKQNLKQLCESTQVQLHEAKGKLIVESDSILDFLGVLDRRVYNVKLVKDAPESFRASSRSKIAPHTASRA